MTRKRNLLSLSPLLLGAAFLGATGCLGKIGGGGDEPMSEPGKTAEALCADGIANAGRSGLRRLTSFEYDAALRDAFDLAQPLELPALPDDEKVGAYDNNALASLSELDVERFQGAAEAAVTQLGPELEHLSACGLEPDDEETCARETLAELAQRLFRRPPSSEQLEELMAVYATGRGLGTYEDGLLLALRAALQSPHFLYHLEHGEDAIADNQAVRRLDAHVLGSRLAFALWQTGPDGELLERAEDGTLLDVDVLEAQARRLLEDDRARRGLVRFASQWLGYDTLSAVPKDETLFPEYGDELVAAMRLEVDELVDDVVRRGDGKLATLLTTRRATVSPALAELYGVASPEGDEIVELPKQERAGLLTRAAFLAAHAHPEQTSPVLRGVFIREHVLCHALPPPPADVDDTAPAVDPDATTRERFAQHTSDASCASCHALIDPVGFGLEAYDPIGRFRTMDGKHPVDDLGELTATDVDGEFEGGIELSERLAESRQVRDCVAEEWFTYAVGRPPADEDTCSLDAIQERFADSGGDLRELIVALVTSSAFRNYRHIENGD